MVGDLVLRAGAVLAIAVGLVAPAAGRPLPVLAQAATPDGGANPFAAGGTVPGSGAGLVLGVVGSDRPGPWETLVRASVQAEASTAGATLVDCGQRLPAGPADGCRGADPSVDPDVVIDLRAAAPAPEACPRSPAVVIVADRLGSACTSTVVGGDGRAAGAIVGVAVGEALRERAGCAADRLLVLGALEPGGVSGDRIAGLREGFASVCGAAVPDGSADVADGAGTVAERLAALLADTPADERLVVLAADDAGGLLALRVADSVGRAPSVRIGAIGGLQPAWASIACSPAWLADAALLPERYGRTIVPAAIALATGAPVPSVLPTPVRLLDASTIRSLYPDVPVC